jgi:hypothetical protein
MDSAKRSMNWLNNAGLRGITFGAVTYVGARHFFAASAEVSLGAALVCMLVPIAWSAFSNRNVR